MKRKTFFLVLSSDPAAVDIVREDFLISRDKDNVKKITFRYEIKKDTFVEVAGTVLLEGFKTHLAQALVDKNGNFLQSKEGSVGTRKQELEKRRLLEARAIPIHLQEIAEDLHEEGAEALAENIPPPVNRLPKKRNEEQMEALKQAEDELECFVESRLKTRLSDDHNIFVDSKQLNLIIIQHGKNPPKFFKELMHLLLPDDFLALDGISPAGKRGCYKIPEKIVTTAAGYATSVFDKIYKQEHGEESEPPITTYDIAGILRNMVSNAKPAHKNYRPKRRAITFPAPAATAVIPPTDPNNNTPSSSTSSQINPTPHSLHHTRTPPSTPTTPVTQPSTPTTPVTQPSTPTTPVTPPSPTTPSDHHYYMQYTGTPPKSRVLTFTQL